MLLPIDRCLVRVDIDYQIVPNCLQLVLGQPTFLQNKLSGATPALADHGQGIAHILATRADHPLGARAVTLEGFLLDQVGDELFLTLLQAQVGEAVLVGDSLIADATETEDEGDDDTGAILAGGAVD